MSIVGSEQWMYNSGASFYPFSIDQSLRFNSGDSAFLSRTTGSATNTFTFSTWLKRGDIPSADYQYIFSSGAAGLAIGKSSDATLKLARIEKHENENKPLFLIAIMQIATSYALQASLKKNATSVRPNH